MLWMPASQAVAANWYPGLRVESRYDDNVLHRPQGSNDVVGVVTPSLFVINRDPITPYELGGHVDFTSYTRTNVKSTRHDEAWLQLSHRPDPRAGLDAHARYIQSLDPIDFYKGVVTTRGDVTSASGDLSADLYVIGGTVRLNRWDYAAGDLLDGHSIDGTGKLYPINTRVTTLALAARHQQLQVGGLRALDADYQTAAFKRHHTENFWSELEAGRVQIDYHDGSPADVRPALAGRFGLTTSGDHGPNGLSFEIADDIATRIDAQVSSRGAGRYASLGWQTSIDADGGIYRIATLSRGGTLAASDTLVTGQAFDAGGSFARVRPVRGIGPKVDQWRASVGMSTPLGPYFTARVGWDFLRQEAPPSGPVAGPSVAFDRNRYSLALMSRAR
jgi:hypothetical protein